MLKRVKSVSMLLFLMAASTGSMNAVSAPAIASSNAIEQQTETCKGVVKVQPMVLLPVSMVILP